MHLLTAPSDNTFHLPYYWISAYHLFCIPVPADVGFMFDTADHPGKDWYTMQNFVKDAVSRMHYGSSRTRVGLVGFNEYASMVTALNQYPTVDGFFGDVSTLHQGSQK